MAKVCDVLKQAITGYTETDPQLHDDLVVLIDTLDTDLESFGFESSEDLDEAVDKIIKTMEDVTIEGDEEASAELATEEDEDEDEEVEEEDDDDDDDDEFAGLEEDEEE